MDCAYEVKLTGVGFELQTLSKMTKAGQAHLWAAEAALEADWLAAADQPEACREASPADADALMAAATRSLYGTTAHTSSQWVETN